ncbi:MAG: metal ABC transporter permease [Oligoflexia bacterium]|nr:metal ABC transporter permease [Oligoflexia bacterium]
MIQELANFWSLSDRNVLWVLLGAALLGLSNGIIGCFAFLQRKSLIGDALAHAALPGVVFMFYFTHSRDPWLLLAGAGLSCIVAHVCSEYLIRRTKIKEDSALAIILSLSFALGVFMLSMIQKLPIPNQAGLDKILFGQAAAMNSADVKLLAISSCILVLLTLLCFRSWRLLVFDPVYATSIGLPVRWLQGALSAALVLAVVIGLQLAGVVLVAALILTPAAAARYWTNKLGTMLILAGMFGALSGVFATQVSYLAPRMPTGPWMVMAVTAIFAVSLLFAPSRGLLIRALRRHRQQLRINEENVLRTMYKLLEQHRSPLPGLDSAQILSFRSMLPQQLELVLKRLKRRSEIVQDGALINFTSSGYQHARALTRRHRLWEAYLAERLGLAADHVHRDAEEIEHILGPDLEAALLDELEQSTSDPHGRSIPRSISKEHEHE